MFFLQIQRITALHTEFRFGIVESHGHFLAGLFAERPINAQGFKVGLDGEYLTDSVEQVYTQAGWSTTVECNGGKKGKAKAHGKKKKKEVKPVKIVSLK